MRALRHRLSARFRALLGCRHELPPALGESGFDPVALAGTVRFEIPRGMAPIAGFGGHQRHICRCRMSYLGGGSVLPSGSSSLLVSDPLGAWVLAATSATSATSS